MNLLNRIKKLRRLSGKATERCSACASPVIHNCSDEGTQSYTAVFADTTNIPELCDALEEMIQFIRLNPCDGGVTKRFLSKWGIE